MDQALVAQPDFPRSRDQSMCAQLDEDGPSVMLAAHRLIAVSRKLQFDAHRLIVCLIRRGLGVWSRPREHWPSPERGALRCTPAVPAGVRGRPGKLPGQRSCRSDYFVSILGPLASPKRMSASALWCWPKAEPPRDERRPNGERRVETRLPARFDSGQGHSETFSVCCRVVPSPLPGVGVDSPP